MRTLAVAALLALTCCQKAKEEAGSAMAGAIVNHELAKQGAHVDMGGMMDAQKAMAEAMKAPPRPPVPFQKLIPLFPDAPAGWNAQKPEGRTMNMGQVQFSEAERRYTKGNAQITLKIMDGMTSAIAGIAMLANVTEETSNGYRKPFTVGGGLGSEEWKSQSKSMDIELLTKKHFLISVEGSGLEDTTPGKDLVTKLDPTKVDAVAP